MPRRILDPADELLSEILFFILQTDRTLYGRPRQNGNRDIDLRGNGSGAASDLDRWRLVCKRLMRIGTPRKSEHFIVRCSGDGFHRLADLQKMRLACCVKSVTYLVRPFYQGNGATIYPCIYITKIPKANVSDNNPGLTKDTTSTRKRKQTPLSPPHSPSARANHPNRNQPRPPTALHSHDQLHIPPRNQAPPSTRRSGRTPHKIYRPPLAPKYTGPNPVYVGTRTHDPKHSPPSPKGPLHPIHRTQNQRRSMSASAPNASHYPRRFGQPPNESRYHLLLKQRYNDPNSGVIQCTRSSSQRIKTSRLNPYLAFHQKTRSTSVSTPSCTV